jgi:hypothetical protein
MNAVYGDELLGINQQAATAAAAVLSEAVLAATLCQSRKPHLLGRGLAGLGGLPDSFILAVTAGSVYVIEDKRKREQLFAGQVLRSWVRSGFRASVDPRPFSPVPADCQLLRLILPIEPVKSPAMNRQLKKVAEMAAARGLPGAEFAFVVGCDAPTEGVIDALTQSSPGARPTVAAGAGTPLQSSTAQRLQELESLHATGVLSDAEYTAKRGQIISEI